MASYVDGFVPEAHQAAFEKALGTLRSAAPRSSSEAIKEVIERELGAPTSELFAELDLEPFASASIGQVHRGRLFDGRQVAVKVQHPGIERAMASDLDNGAVIESLVGSMGGRKLGSAEVFREIRRRFEEELDYGHEAENQRIFGRMFEGHGDIVIPSVVAERSSRRVLTTRLVAGETLDEAAQAPLEVRERWGRALWTYVFASTIRHGRFNADPHPGNFLFQREREGGGRAAVAFLDVGCVQPLGEEERRSAVRMHRAAAARDEAAFRQASVAMMGLTGGRYEEVTAEYVRLCFEPLFRAPFKLTRAYVSEVVQATQKLKESALFVRDGSLAPLPPSLALLSRLQFGFYSVMARLDVELDFPAIEREFLPD